MIEIVALTADPGIYSWGHELYSESWGCDVQREPQTAFEWMPLALAKVLSVV